MTTEEQEFRALVSRYQTDVLRMCYMLLQDVPQAEDATQETFLKAWKNWEHFRRESSEKTWLMHIAVNTCRSFQRTWWAHHVDRRVIPEQLDHLSIPSPEDHVLLHVAVEHLPIRQREVVILYYFQGMDVQEIARALRIAPSSVSGRLKRARKALEIELKGEYFHEDIE